MIESPKLLGYRKCKKSSIDRAWPTCLVHQSEAVEGSHHFAIVSIYHTLHVAITDMSRTKLTQQN